VSTRSVPRRGRRGCAGSRRCRRTPRSSAESGRSGHVCAPQSLTAAVLPNGRNRTWTRPARGTVYHRATVGGVRFLGVDVFVLATTAAPARSKRWLFSRRRSPPAAPQFTALVSSDGPVPTPSSLLPCRHECHGICPASCGASRADTVRGGDVLVIFVTRANAPEATSPLLRTETAQIDGDPHEY
jgi:hypothetical protein